MWWPMPEARGEKIVRSVPRSRWSLSCAPSIEARISSSDIFSAGARRQRRLVLDRLGLVLAEAVQVLGLGRVVAVAIDDHGPVACDDRYRIRFRSGYRSRRLPLARMLRTARRLVKPWPVGNAGRSGDRLGEWRRRMSRRLRSSKSPRSCSIARRTIEVALASIDGGGRTRRLAPGLSRGLHPGISDLDLAAEARRGRRAHRRDPCAAARQCRRSRARRSQAAAGRRRQARRDDRRRDRRARQRSSAARRCSTPSSSSAPTARCSTVIAR